MSTVSIPAVMDPLAFEGVLSCAYTGRLRMLREDIVNYLTVGSVLQMWHIVDKCTELLREGRVAAGGAAGGGALAQEGGTAGGGGGGAGSTGLQHGCQAARPSLSESQSPSSTNYFSPRHGNSVGGSGAVAAGTSGEGGGASHTPRYCGPSGGEEAFLNEEEEEDVEGEEEVLYHQRKRRRGGGGGSGRRKKSSSAPDQEAGVSDSFGVSSYQVSFRNERVESWRVFEGDVLHRWMSPGRGGGAGQAARLQPAQHHAPQAVGGGEERAPGGR